MTTSIPFPELKAFDTPPLLPTFQEFLEKYPSPPANSQTSALPTGKRGLPVFPTDAPGFTRSPRAFSTKALTPLPTTSGVFQQSNVPLVTAHFPSPSAQPVAPIQAASPNPPVDPTAPAELSHEPTSSPFQRLSAVSAAMEDEPEVTDEELRRAFEPIVESSLERVLYSPDKGLHTYLEPMLRSTVRRAIAEQIDTAVQFRSTGPMDRLGWRLKALLTSRSYDEVVFQSTRRYQVEEAYLLRKEDFSLISYASHDPARHASPHKVKSTISSLSARLLDADRRLVKSYDFSDNRVVIVREGKYTVLAAIVRGRSNALVRADLDFVLRQAEERFGERLEDDTDAFIHVLQPILEGCLLIQSPAPPN